MLAFNCLSLRSDCACPYSAPLWLCRLLGKDYRQRSLTAILYLNPSDWDNAPGADGGSLKCYLGAEQSDVDGSTATSVLRVCPQGGTLVLFDSRYLLHEVEPSHRDRLALTLWVVGDKNTESSNLPSL